MSFEPRPLSILIVDDEAPARTRLRELLADLAPALPTDVVGEAENGVVALQRLSERPAAVVLADIRMPRMDGIELAGHLGSLPVPPAVVFTTAYDHYAVQAFELNAIDYLLKPVRATRLQTALEKVQEKVLDKQLSGRSTAAALTALGRAVRGGGRTHLSCHERGRLLLVPVAEVLYFRADLKYVTARTREREYLLDEALTHLEQEFADSFVRVHRAVLVARTALAGFERAAGEDAEAYGWALLRDAPEKLPVSRRQWGVAKILVRGA